MRDVQGSCGRELSLHLFFPNRLRSLLIDESRGVGSVRRTNRFKRGGLSAADVLVENIGGVKILLHGDRALSVSIRGLLLTIMSIGEGPLFGQTEIELLVQSGCLSIGQQARFTVTRAEETHVLIFFSSRQLIDFVVVHIFLVRFCGMKRASHDFRTGF